MSVRHISVDIEADGPYPGEYSMIELGACVVEDMEQRFITQLAPISETWNPDSLAVSGYTREETERFIDAETAISDFVNWLYEVSDQRKHRVVFVSDNPVFDGMFVWYYLGRFYCEPLDMKNPFGYSGVSITSLYKGYECDMGARFHYLRRTKHTHNALEDAVGNAEALGRIFRKMDAGKRMKEKIKNGEFVPKGA